MDTEKWFNEKLTALENDPDFRLEEIILDLTEQISVKMKEKRMTRAKLADLLGVTPAAVTKLLNGNPNFTLKTLLKVADVLDLKFNVSFSALKPIGKVVKIQTSIVPTANDDIYPSKEQPKIPFSWNSDDSTMIFPYDGSLRC